MRISYVIVTHNRRDVLLRTLGIVTAPTADAEYLVVDNGSTDGTKDALRREFPQVRVIRRPSNEGVSARNHAFAVARGDYVVLIDDDSYPVGDAVERSVSYLDANPRTGAVVGRVALPDGRLEASAFPTVMINCAVCIRRSALDLAGGFPTDFFRQAEEYDLSFRFWQAGFAVERFEDVLYRHEKSPGNRASAVVHKLDLRNNLIVADRYLPRELRSIYRHDWTRRYLALAQHAGHIDAAWEGLHEARELARFIARRGRSTLDAAAIESIFGFESQAREVATWAGEHRPRNVLISDFSKNLFATYRACRAAGLNVLGVTDNHPAYDGLTYRGLPVGQDAVFLRGGADAIVLSNVNPGQVDRRAAELRDRFDLPVLTLWRPRLLSDTQPRAEARAA
ncbi:MAG: glycosyltransferase [Planctomycetes bacterium]|nr:glycosyltransferase [Planctomycetota bacterium]